MIKLRLSEETNTFPGSNNLQKYKKNGYSPPDLFVYPPEGKIKIIVHLFNLQNIQSNTILLYAVLQRMPDIHIPVKFEFS